MQRISCLECKQCNRKGKPSVSRFSKLCDERYKKPVRVKTGLFDAIIKLKDKIFDKRYDANKNDLNTKGFRKDWFMR